MATTKRKRYTKDFKLEAVRLVESGDQPVAEISRQLGVKREQLYLWRDQVKKHGPAGAFNGPGRPAAPSSDELVELRKELERVKEERDILKKAAAYFAKELP